MMNCQCNLREWNIFLRCSAVIQIEGMDYHPERTFLAGLDILISGLFGETEK